MCHSTWALGRDASTEVCFALNTWRASSRYSLKSSSHTPRAHFKDTPPRLSFMHPGPDKLTNFRPWTPGFEPAPGGNLILNRPIILYRCFFIMSLSFTPLVPHPCLSLCTVELLRMLKGASSTSVPLPSAYCLRSPSGHLYIEVSAQGLFQEPQTLYSALSLTTNHILDMTAVNVFGVALSTSNLSIPNL